MNMKLKLLFMLLLALYFPAHAATQANYCHNLAMNQDWDKKVVEFSQDPIILKLAGLRTGLCQMIDRGQITHEQGINLWEDERQRSIVDRQTEQARQKPKYVL
jgi:hypothetical protein